MLRLRSAYGYVAAGRVVSATDAAKRAGAAVEDVLNKYTSEPFSQVHLAPAEVIEECLDAGVEQEATMAALMAHEKHTILSQLQNAVKRNADLLAQAITLEAGKPISLSKTEVQRCLAVLEDSKTLALRGLSEEGWRDCGSAESGPMSLITRRFPVGLLSFVSPYNFPLNLVMHKVAPAIVAGCPFVLKPSNFTPVTALLVGELLAKDTDMPEGSFSVLPCAHENAKFFSEDDRPKMLSFTGSPAVGWKLKQAAGRKKVALELGGNAATVVDEDADLDSAVKQLAAGAFGYSGQTCISVQRILIHENVYDEVKKKLVEATEMMNQYQGDPMKLETQIAPLINLQAAEKMEKWTAKAVSKGAKVLVGGKRDGNTFDATILEDVPKEESLWCEEAFGPVAVLRPFSSFKEAVAEVNDSEFGLQVGYFTRDMHKVIYAYEHSNVGGVVINGVSGVRTDIQAYGGSKASGMGREGAQYAAEDFSELRTLLLKDVGRL